MPGNRVPLVSASGFLAPENKYLEMEMAGTLQRVGAQAPRTFSSMSLSPEEFRRVWDLVIPAKVTAVRPGDVRYTGARKISTESGVVVRHVFLAIDVVEYREDGRVFFDGAEFLPHEDVAIVARAR